VLISYYAIKMKPKKIIELREKKIKTTSRV